jgi:hypothetical protein
MAVKPKKRMKQLPLFEKQKRLNRFELRLNDDEVRWAIKLCHHLRRFACSGSLSNVAQA